MRRFLVVGCGGSGGVTLRYMMDQLLADLRPYGVTELPGAWQFVHIDVPTKPESGPRPLQTVPQLGGRYFSVSSETNTYELTAGTVERKLAAQGELSSLLGWPPRPKERASFVPVANGAGQFRAIGRMLTLRDVDGIRGVIEDAWRDLQQPDVWEGIPTSLRGSDTTGSVVPIVLASMAGGSGASMFLDVCRILGSSTGVNPAELGVFLYTADLFHQLPEDLRQGIEGNSLAAMAELIAAQSGASVAEDAAVLRALGLARDTEDLPFQRIFPIGSSIGGDGAKFGGGTTTGVYRGLGRALAALVSSSAATEGYVAHKVGNPAGITVDQSSLGWGVDPSRFLWGSMGYASLSLGRDRYTEYAGQRLARRAVERLLRGHLDSLSTLPATEQLASNLDAQWPTALERLGLPGIGDSVKTWFTASAFPDVQRASDVRAVVGEAMSAIETQESARAEDYVRAIGQVLPHYQPSARTHVSDAAYLWAESFAAHLEATVLEEFLNSSARQGLPYARGLVQRLSGHLDFVIDELRRAGAGTTQDPLVLDNDVLSKAAALKKTVIGAGHALTDLLRRGLEKGADRSLKTEAARLAAEVLTSLRNDVLKGLEQTADSALIDLEAAEAQRVTEAGLAQLATNVVAEWPTESDLAPARFDHAENEVLLTTSAEFPARFRDDVSQSVPAARLYDQARETIVGEILIGRWETTGGQRGTTPVLIPVRPWRPSSLPIAAGTRTPTPASKPTYRLAISSEDVLTRARAHVARPDQPFARFSTQSISSYLTEDGLPQALLAQRQHDFVAKFAETLKLARPLVGVSPEMVQVLHPGHRLTYEYTFGSIPLDENSPVVAEILTDLASQSQTLDPNTLDTFRGALLPTAQDARIAVYGSYKKYSPLVFSSLLEPLQRRWATTPAAGRKPLWEWKRTRPLAAGLAMSQVELATMVSGWFVGRALGLVRTPDSPTAGQPVQVWDVKSREWLAFPSPMLTPPTEFKVADDWLPAVLESHTLAIVNCNQDRFLRALAPYRALRGLYDGHEQGPRDFTEFQQPDATSLFAEWLSTGSSPSGIASQVLANPADTPEGRYTQLVEWIDAVRGYVADRYLRTGGGVGNLGALRVMVDSQEQLVSLPMFSQIAPTVHAALADVRRCADAARTLSQPQEDSYVGVRPAF